MIFEIKQIYENTIQVKMYIMKFEELYRGSKWGGSQTGYLEKIISGDFENEREEDIYNKYQELISQDMPNQAVEYFIRIETETI